MLISKNLYQQRPNKKLSDRYLGPFKIIEIVREQAYKLKLLKKWIIYSIFYISLLEPYKRRPSEDPASYLELVLLYKDKEWYKIKEILDDRRRRRHEVYLIY